MKITIKVNGKPQNIEEISIIEYLQNKEINIDNIIVLLNDNIIKKEKFKEIILKDNDNLEIVKFVGGG